MQAGEKLGMAAAGEERYTVGLDTAAAATSFEWLL
jgi:hypothetical protein